jgi:hypothetical protein
VSYWCLRTVWVYGDSSNDHGNERSAAVVKDVLMFMVLFVLGVWLALQWWVLPRLGVPT